MLVNILPCGSVIIHWCMQLNFEEKIPCRTSLLEDQRSLTSTSLTPPCFSPSYFRGELHSLLFIFNVCVKALDAHFIILESLWTKIFEMWAACEETIYSLYNKVLKARGQHSSVSFTYSQNLQPREKQGFELYLLHAVNSKKNRNGTD